MSTFDEQTDFSFLSVSVADKPKAEIKTKKNWGTDSVRITLTKTISNETKSKMSKAKLGKPKSAEHIAKTSAALKGKPSPMKGRTHSEEAKSKIRAKRKLQGITVETRAKMSASNKGKVRSQEFKDNLRQMKLGIPRSDECRAKMSATKSKPVMTAYGVYPSCMAVAEAANVTRATVYMWMKKYPEHYYYIKESK